MLDQMDVMRLQFIGAEVSTSGDDMQAYYKPNMSIQVLVQLLLHYGAAVDTETIIDQFSRRHPLRMQFISRYSVIELSQVRGFVL